MRGQDIPFRKRIRACYICIIYRVVIERRIFTIDQQKIFQIVICSKRFTLHTFLLHLIYIFLNSPNGKLAHTGCEMRCELDRGKSVATFHPLSVVRISEGSKGPDFHRPLGDTKRTSSAFLCVLLNGCNCCFINARVYAR